MPECLLATNKYWKGCIDPAATRCIALNGKPQARWAFKRLGIRVIAFVVCVEYGFHHLIFRHVIGEEAGELAFPLVAVTNLDIGCIYPGSIGFVTHRFDTGVGGVVATRARMKTDRLAAAVYLSFKHMPQIDFRAGI